MTFLQIQYFLKTAECMSFSQAAQQLYVTQPSVSRQIKQLEQELGYPLFVRTQKNAIRLTPAGIVFQDAFSQMQTIYHRAVETAQSLSSHSPLQLKIGIGSGWDMSTALLRVKNQLTQHYPQAELLFETHEDRPLSAADFQGQTLLMLSQEESPMAMELALLQFQARQITVVPKYLPNRDSILQALLLGEGVTVFDPYMRFSNDPRLTWFNLEDDIPVCVVWSRHNPNPLIRLFADSMEKALNP